MVGIVILNFNNSSATRDCLASIIKHETTKRYKICLVDNSTDAEDRTRTMQYVDKLKKKAPLAHIHVILLNKNEGYAKGNNVGIKYFEKEKEISHILILNNDIILTMPILESLEYYLCEHRECAVVSPILYNKEGGIDTTCARRRKGLYSFLVRTPLVRKLGWIRQKNKSEYILEEKPIQDFNLPIDIDLPSGSCMMFEKDVFRKMGYFDPHTFLYFEEDILWSKMQEIGLKAAMLPFLSCIHIGASSIGKQPSKAMKRHYFSSMLYYLGEYSGLKGIWPWVIRLLVKLFYKV